MSQVVHSATGTAGSWLNNNGNAANIITLGTAKSAEISAVHAGGDAGPDREGRVPEAFVKRMKEIGRLPDAKSPVK